MKKRRIANSRAVPTEREKLVAEIRDYLPSQTELCQISATLAQGKTFTRIAAQPIAEQAIALWDACAQAITECVASRADSHMKARARLADCPSIPIPANPNQTSLKEFLCLNVNGKTEADRMARYRAFLREKHGDKKADAVMTAERKTGFDQGCYYSTAVEFRKWNSAMTRTKNRQRAVKAAQARHARKNP